MVAALLLSFIFASLHMSVLAFDPSGIPRECGHPCGEADLEGFNSCFDLVMSARCRAHLCEEWYYNTMLSCLNCIIDHKTGQELQDFTSIVDVYNSTCQNRSLVSDDTFLNGTYLNGSTVNSTVPDPAPTMPEATAAASALRCATPFGGLLLVAGAAALLL